MKKAIIILTVLVATLTISNCSNKSESKSTSERETDFNSNSSSSTNKDSIGTWAQKGVECYGIIIANQQNNKTIGKSVKCKIIAISEGKIKLKALENVNLSKSNGCNKLGVSYGYTWWETEGDLYRTREEADQLLKDKGWLIK